ncbi:SDR family NAD(P)-dependent oxidoreductase [Tunturiibacter lichenicola]|uniref:SDR family NAD(P)-dependent oxidoreductase n=1 Tax=Tunturiibacter lichenicola TaxID=2051959 RepID=UPI003D9BAE7A
MASLQGKTVLITGASSGIGRATALAFAQEGVSLLLCARRLDRLEELQQALSAAGAASVHVFKLDVQHRAEVESAISNLPAGFRDIDILVNNAGLSRGLAKLYEDDPQNWEEMIDTNVKGLLYVTRAVVPGMVARGRGHVINLGSTAAYITYANGAVYCASKAAEKAISEGLKIDLMGTPIRVTSIDAGMVETDFSKVRFRGDEEKAAKIYQNITPLQPEDVAEAIVWAASRPPHVNIHNVLMTTIDQANSTVFNRRG